MENVIQSRFSCNLYVHQAKIRTGNIKSGLANARVVAYLSNAVAATKTSENTLSPVWNEMLTINFITIYGPPSTLQMHSPLVALELYDGNRSKVIISLIHKR